MSGERLNLKEVAGAILAAVVDHFTAAEVALPDRRYVAAGDPTQVAWDCEQLVVACQGVGWGQAPDSSTLSPKMGTQVSAVGVRHAVFIIQLVRCTPTGDDSDGFPSVTELQAAGDAYMVDMGLLSQALLVACSTVRAGLDRGAKVEPGAVNPDGPSGGFHGMSAQMAITVGNLV